MLINDYKDLNNKRPLSELMAESLDSAVIYSDKITGAVRELLLEVEEADSKGIIMQGDKILPTVRAVIDGVDWLFKMYDHCQFFSSVPIYDNEDRLIKAKIICALKYLMEHIEREDTQYIIYALKNELLPGLRMLDAKIKDLAKFAAMRGKGHGIALQ